MAKVKLKRKLIERKILKINNLGNSKKISKEMFEKFLITKHGHPGSVFSMMEIAVTLFYGGFVRFDDKKIFQR